MHKEKTCTKSKLLHYLYENAKIAFKNLFSAKKREFSAKIPRKFDLEKFD